MSRHHFVALVLIALTVFGVLGIIQVSAQTQSSVLIKPDGSIVGTDKILREGNVYRLNGYLDIEPIVVECNNIILDGAGFSSTAMSGWSEIVAINLTATNVTVKNFNIANYGIGILGAWNHNIIANNTFRNVIKAISIYADGYTVENNIIQNSAFYAIRILNSHNNTFFGNQILDCSIGVDVTNSSGDIAEANAFESNHEAFRIRSGSFQVYHNNFINQFQEVRPGAYSKLVLSSYSGSIFWDNGYPSGGNYYSDYFTRYPNATEIDNSGIGNSPYEVCINTNFTDRYPLLNPVNITATIIELPSLTPSSTISPSPTPTASLTLTPTPSIPEFPHMAIAIAAASFLCLILAFIASRKKSVFTK